MGNNKLLLNIQVIEAEKREGEPEEKFLKECSFLWCGSLRKKWTPKGVAPLGVKVLLEKYFAVGAGTEFSCSSSPWCDF